MISKFSLFLLIPSFLVSSTLPLPLLSQVQMAQAAEAKTAIDTKLALSQRDTQTYTVSYQVATAPVERDAFSATSQSELDARKAAVEKKKQDEEAAKVQAAADAAAKAIEEKSASNSKVESTSSSKDSSSSSPALPSVTPDPGSAQAYAQQAVKARGWSDSDFSCLVSLWNKESGWRVNAFNPAGPAYGIPQAVPGSKMASAGSDWATNPNTQIEWGLGYIASVYGTPCNAWAHSQAQNWY